MPQILSKTGWEFDEAGSPIIYEKDGTTEKIRSFKTSGKSGAYKMITDICSLFETYPVFDSSDIRNKKVRIYPISYRGELRELVIGRDVSSIDFEENTEDLVTRLYVEGEYGDDGYVGIDDQNVDLPGMSFLLNFSYYQNAGLFTEEHDRILTAFKANIIRATQDLRAYQTQVTAEGNELNTVWGQPNAVVYE